MKRIVFVVGVLLLSSVFIWADTIEKIIIQGNKKVSRETVTFYMKSHEKGFYSEQELKSDFKSLWDTGFFESIRMETENGELGKIINVIVKENDVIASITYKTGKKIKEKDINEKLQEKNISLMQFSYYSPVKIKKVKKIIEDMLVEKGYNDGSVSISEKRDQDQVSLAIQVNQGPRTRIGSVCFPGLNEKLVSANFLTGGMKKNKLHSLLSVVGGKDVFTRENLPEDMEGILLRLQEKGFLEAKLGQPEFKMAKGLTVFGKTRNMMQIAIPVEMGPQYRLRDVIIEGNKVIPARALRAFITMKKNRVFNAKKRNKDIEEMQKFYGTLGYAYCQIIPAENLDPVKKVADLSIKIAEGEIVYIGKIDFTGNSFTKDHVIRREWFLREGSRFNVSALETSIRRMKQLGLVEVEKMPEIKPDPQDPQKLNINCTVKELNRQMVSFNFGYSGYEGWFVMLGYSTQNFLGMGESLSASVTKGTRTKNYRLGFSEPYLFNLPASLGINVYKTTLQYPNLYDRDGKGFDVSSSVRFWKFWGASLAYSLEDVSISNVQFDVPDDPYYAYYYSEGKRAVSSLSPTIYYSTVDSPIFPTSGVRYLFNYRYSGGVLGGDVDLHRVKFEVARFVSMRRNTLGLHLQYEHIIPFNKNSDEVPFWERIYLGGEQSIRGFDIFQLGPRNGSGQILGGGKALFLNGEYIFSLNKQFSLVMFYDVGNAFAFNKPVYFNDMYTSLGMELRVFIEMMGVPLRLIFAYNPRVIKPTDSHFAFRFAVGPSF